MMREDGTAIGNIQSEGMHPIPLLTTDGLLSLELYLWSCWKRANLHVRNAVFIRVATSDPRPLHLLPWVTQHGCASLST